MVIVKKNFLLFVFLFFVGCSVFSLNEKSSVVPDKREFPVDENVKPCDNFYAYTCNKVVESFKLREDRSRHSFAFTDQADRLLKIKKDYFKELPMAKTQNKMEVEVKNFYLSCMDTESRSWEENNLVQLTLKEMDKIKTREEFLEYISLEKENFQTRFLSFRVVTNFDRPKYYDIDFSIPLSIFPEKSYLENKDLVSDFIDLSSKFFQIIGFSKTESEMRSNKLLSFQREFLDTYPNSAKLYEMVDSRTEIKRDDLVKKYPNLKLKKFLDKNVPKNTLIRNTIGSESFLFLDKKLGSMELADLKNLYLYYRLNGVIDESNPDFYQEKIKFNNKYLGGAPVREELQERCSKITVDHFMMEVDYILLPRVYPNFPKERFMKMVERIRSAFIDTIEKNKWLSSDSKKEALRKLRKTRFNMVSPSKLAHWNFNLRREYVKNQYIKNLMVYSRMNREKTISELGKPVDMDRWEMGPLMVNAYFEPSQNIMVFPIGILQPPFYDASLSDDINLGAIGMVIAHELGHSIDNQGSTYDADGIKREWMKGRDRQELEKRTLPLVQLFNEAGHNGKFTLGENIGDFVGISQSYKAAFELSSTKNIKNNKELKKDYFLAYARLWCEVERSEYSQLRLKIDPHSLGYARVNQQLMLNKDFQEAFQCKEGDFMVAPKEKRVSIW